MRCASTGRYHTTERVQLERFAPKLRYPSHYEPTSGGSRPYLIDLVS